MLAGLKIKSGQDSGEFFIDAGAFRGDTVEEFLQLIGYNPESAAANFAKIIAIEPDIKNHTLLRRKFYAFGTAIWQAVHGAAWNADESLTFSLKSGRAGHILRRDDLDDLPYKGRTIEIPGVRIDSLVGDDDKVTFIKIDVEGAERQVLEGAKSTITRCRPKMLVSLYHRCEDMFELPLLLHSYYAGYKFALRKTHCVPGWEFQLIVTK
jgi:FkbM family methyltransferase